MELIYKNTVLSINSNLIEERRRVLSDTEEDIEELVLSFLAARYGDNFKFYVQRVGIEGIIEEVEEYLKEDLILYSEIN